MSAQMEGCKNGGMADHTAAAFPSHLAVFRPFHSDLELSQPEPFPPITWNWNM